jgi:carboxypeptidase C (cathepsin A)
MMTSDAGNKGEQDKNEAQVTSPGVKDNIVTTQHSIKLGGKLLRYTAKVGTVVLKEEDDKKGHLAKAEMFFMSFTKDGVKDKSKRPITFSFNGGPGSSSVWMLLGLLGPKRVPLTKSASERLKPPYALSDNEFSLLLESDLVFIDPVGTGYSRPVTGEDTKPDEFYTFQRDLDSVGEFIRLMTSRENRWGSPKFLIGESYGTTRATGLAAHLQQHYGMALNGIMLVSVVLNFQTLLFGPGNDLPYVLYLPSYALAARYHGKLSPRLQKLGESEFLDEVRGYAEGDYSAALFKGARLDGDERAQVIKKVSEYTGLSQDYVAGANLRIEIMRFTKELLRSQQQVIGRFDSRITGIDSNDSGEMFDSDPSMDTAQAIYSACLNDFVRKDLQFESDLPYEIISFKVHPKWRYDSFENSYVNTAEMLRVAMQKNPNLQVLVVNGLYDLATPFFATEYTFDHLGVRGDLQDNLKHTYFPAGHMMYTDKGCLKKLTKEIHQFVKKSS